MRNKEVICEICLNKFKSYTEMISHSKKGTRQICTSDCGVYLDPYRVWFCNSCWKQLIRYYLNKKKVGGLKTYVPEECLL